VGLGRPKPRSQRAAGTKPARLQAEVSPAARPPRGSRTAG
jgi:hypothetical protein